MENTERLPSQVNDSAEDVLLAEKQAEAAEWPRCWRAYVALGSGFLMMFDCWGIVMAFGAFFGLYDIHLLRETPDLQLSLIGGTQAFLILFLSPVVGRLLDARYHYFLGAVGFLCLFLGYMGLSFTSGDGLENQGTYWAIWLSSAIAGIGQACFFVYSSQNAAQWFPKKKFVAIGITSAGAAAGGVVYPVIFKFLVARFAFPSAVRIFSAIVGITSFAAFIGGSPAPGIAKRPIDSVKKPSTWIDKKAVRDKAFLWYTTGVMFIYLGLFVLSFYVTLWAHEKGVGTEEDREGGTGVWPGNGGFRTFWFLSVMNACSLIGRIGGGVIASRFFNPLIVHSISCSITALFAFVWWPLVHNTPSAILFVAFIGGTGGAAVGLQASGIAYIIPDQHQTSLGQWTGMALSASAMPAFIGPLIAGALLKRFGTNAAGFWSGSMMLASSICILVSWREKLRRGKPKSSQE